MNRHLTRLMPTFVRPVARSIATRARGFGVFVALVTALAVLGALGMFSEMSGRSTHTSDGTIAIVIVGVICAGLAFWTYTIFRLGSRAARLARRTADPDARFIMETTRIGELGVHGGVLPGTAIRITAEQFTHLLSTPRPPLDAASAVAPMDPSALPRAIVRPRDRA